MERDPSPYLSARALGPAKIKEALKLSCNYTEQHERIGRRAKLVHRSE